MSFASRSENTCNALLCEELRRFGVEAWFEEHFLTQFGTSKPDVYARWKNANYFVEAKQRPHKLVDAVSKAYTYQKRLQAVSPKAFFAVLYPPDCFSTCEAAVLLNQPPFYIHQSTSSLQELAKWIYEIITAPPVTVELNTTDAIKLLREAVARISEFFAKIEAKDVEEIFGGRVFFETILGVREEKQIPIEHLRNAASYLLVNQILFYQILAKEKKELIRYKEIDSEKIAGPDELQTKYFSKVLLEDYKPIFGFDVASKIKGSKALEAVKVAIDSVNALSPGALGHDVLGKIFHNLIPLDLRKVIASFYTNIQAGEILATLAIEKPDAMVIDPACGSGTLLVSAYQRKKDLLEKSGKKFGFSDHKRFVEEELTGIDIMPFAAHLAAVHLSLQAPLYTTDFVRVAIQDSTSLKPHMAISPAQEVLKEAFKQRKLTEDFSRPVGKAKEKIAAGVVELSEQANLKPVQLSKVDLVIMNPPFTRFQRIPPSYKTKLSERFEEAKYQKCVHGQLGLHGYFLLLADRFLKEGGRLAAVLPVTTLSIKSFYDVQDLLLRGYRIEYIFACGGRSAFSENTTLREILLISKKERTQDSKTAIVILKVSPDAISIADARLLAETVRELRETRNQGVIIDSEKFLFRLIGQSELVASKRSLFRAISLNRKELTDLNERLGKLYRASEKLQTLERYIDKVKGETYESPTTVKQYGYYSIAIVNKERRAKKKHDVWVVKSKGRRSIIVENRFTHVTFILPMQALSPNIRRYTDLPSIDVTDNPDWVIIEPFQDLELFLDSSGRPQRETKEALTSITNGFWRKLVEQNRGYLTLIRRSDITAKGTLCLSYYSDIPIFFGSAGALWGINIPNRDEAKVLCLWFNSSLNLFQMLIDRKETRGGYMQIDDYVMREFIVPDFEKLSNAEMKMLLNLFQKIRHEEFPSIHEQLRNKHPIRKELDMTILKIIGMPEDYIESFLVSLYKELDKELVKLKEVMAEGRPSEGEET